MATGEEILAIAGREIGYHEGKNKHNKYGEWYGMDNAKWCMEFVLWVYHEAGIDLYKTASCGTLLRWYQKNQPECIVKEPVRGCIVIFDFPGTKYDTDHTGLFVSATEDRITSIDGNTSNGADANGGYVQQRTRKLSYARPIYIVPRELRAAEEDEDMEPRFNTMREISDNVPWATETVAKLIEHGTIKGSGLVDEQGRPADMNLSVDMLRILVWNDREGLYK